jgi:hypothetical protein
VFSREYPIISKNTFEQTFKNIDDILHKDAGCGSELDYVEQTSWILFLKYLDDFEKDRKTGASLSGKEYKTIIDEKFRWENWAVPKNSNRKTDHNVALSGDDLRDFVDHELFPYLKKFKQSAESPDTIEYKIGEIFCELKNKIQSGYNLREILNLVDELHFQTATESKPISSEEFIRNMFDAVLPEFFKSEEELRIIWSDPLTRKNFLDRIADAGCDKEKLSILQKMIDAEKSDLYDVLAYFSFEIKPMTRIQRVNEAKGFIYKDLNDKQIEFLDFVLTKYIENGVETLDESQLANLILLKYNAFTDAERVFG